MSPGERPYRSAVSPGSGALQTIRNEVLNVRVMLHNTALHKVFSFRTHHCVLWQIFDVTCNRIVFRTSTHPWDFAKLHVQHHRGSGQFHIRNQVVV